MKSALIHLIEIVKLLLKSDKKFTDEDLKFGREAYLFRTCLNFIVCVSYYDVKSKIEFKTQVNVESLKMYIERAFENE